MIGEDAKIVGKSPLDFVSWKDDLSLTLINDSDEPSLFRLFGVDAGLPAFEEQLGFPEYDGDNLTTAVPIGDTYTGFNTTQIITSDNWMVYPIFTPNGFKVINLEDLNANIDVFVAGNPSVEALSISESLDEVYAVSHQTSTLYVYNRFTGAFKHSISVTTDMNVIGRIEIDEVRQRAYVIGGSSTYQLTIIETIDLVSKSVIATTHLDALTSSNQQKTDFATVHTSDYIYTTHETLQNSPNGQFSISKFSKINNSEVSFATINNDVNGFFNGFITHCPSQNCIVGCSQGEVYKYDLSTDTFVQKLSLPIPLEARTCYTYAYNNGDNVLLRSSNTSDPLLKLNVEPFAIGNFFTSPTLADIWLATVDLKSSMAILGNLTASGYSEVLDLDTDTITDTLNYTNALSGTIAILLSGSGNLDAYHVTGRSGTNYIEKAVNIGGVGDSTLQIKVTTSIDQINEEFKYNPIKVGCIKFESSSREQLTSKMEYKYSNATGKEQSSNIQLINYVPAMRSLNVGFVDNLDFVFDGQNALEVTVQPNSRLFLSFYYRETKFAFIQSNIEGGYMNNDEI
jgi:hypothetical protein